MNLKTMRTRNLFGFLVAVLAILFVLPSASAFADINAVTVDGVEFNDFASDPSVAVFAGDTLGVRTTFTSFETDEKVRVTARILGEPGTLVDTEEFAVISGNTYSRLLNVDVPFDLDDEIHDTFALEVSIESRNSGEADSILIDLLIQRESDLIEILAIESQDEVKAGENVVFDVVVKNRGRQEAEDNFVKASIPALGVSRLVFLGDLDAQERVDETDRDLEDSALGRVFLQIPRNAPAGVYNVEIEAFNDDATTIASRKVVVVGSGADSRVISSTNSKTFAAGEDQEYSVTIVNADNTIKVYELVLEAANGLTVSLEDSIVAVPAGSSKTVALTARAAEQGNFNFAVNVHSDGELVNKQSFVANVDGRSAGDSSGNAAIVLTIILAIIFVVLLIVLIVLLTRKPEKTEDFGESYY